MKKLKLIILPALLLLAGCWGGEPTLSYERYDDTKHAAKVDDEGFTLIDFYGLNDFHGAIERSVDDKMPGLAAINTFLKTKRAENPGGTVFIANGDMWQGSADSNITKGKLVNESLNYMGFAAFTLGNHEFDWSIAQIKENKASFDMPYLGVNIIEKDTRKNPDFIDESPLIERDGVKIGIIGAMGSELINTIQGSYVENFEFDIMTDYVSAEATRLREAGANLVFLATHDSWVGESLSTDRSALVENKIVDAVFTGHQHYLDEKVVSGVPILQTRGRGRDIMHVQLGFNKTSKEVKVANYEVIRDIAALEIEEDETTKTIIDYYVKKFNVEGIKNEVVGQLINKDMTRMMLAKFISELMTESVEDAVGGLHNVTGGIRAELKVGDIKYSDVYNVFPFDNEIYVIELLGRRLQGLMGAGGNYSYYFKIAYEDVEANKTYKVVTTNFVYELSGSPVTGLPFENLYTYPRDLVADYFRTNKTLDGSKY